MVFDFLLEVTIVSSSLSAAVGETRLRKGKEEEMELY